MVSKMKKLLVVDITSLSRNMSIYGHGIKVAHTYKNALGKQFEVYICGGAPYKNEFNEAFESLPFYTDLNDSRYIRLIKGCINAVNALLKSGDILIFQNQDITPLYFVLSFWPKCLIKKKIFIIEYSNPLNTPSRPKECKYFDKIQHKIDGVITSLEDVGNIVKCNAFIIPDYFPDKSVKPKDCEKKYDFACLGTISEKKELEKMVGCIKNTKYKLLIAGKFLDEGRKQSLLDLRLENVTIVDAYLDSDEYNAYLKEARFVVLPYNRKHYEEKSSGVALEAIYNGVPVIAPNIKSFKFVEDYGLGILYNDSFAESFQELNIDYSKNIEKFISNIETVVQNFLQFLDK